MRVLPWPVEAVDSTGASGASYTLVRRLFAPALPSPPPCLVLQGVTLGALHCAASVLCFFLARHFVSPLQALQHGACLLARGDFSVRVDPELWQRRGEFGALARDFDHMAEQLGRLVEAQLQLLRDISHELRSPLTRLGVALELTRKQAPKELTPFFQRIEKESQRLNAPIACVLNFARLDYSAMPLSQERVALHRVVEEVARDADFEARGKGCTAVWTIQPAGVVGAEDLLRSAVDNILRNAVQYAPQGTAVTVTMRWSGKNREDRIEILVEDQEPGVAPHQLEEIFRPFFE